MQNLIGIFFHLVWLFAPHRVLHLSDYWEQHTLGKFSAKVEKYVCIATRQAKEAWGIMVRVHMCVMSGALATDSRGSVPLHWARRYNVNNHPNQPIRRHTVLHPCPDSNLFGTDTLMPRTKFSQNRQTQYEVLDDTRQKRSWHYLTSFWCKCVSKEGGGCRQTCISDGAESRVQHNGTHTVLKKVFHTSQYPPQPRHGSKCDIVTFRKYSMKNSNTGC